MYARELPERDALLGPALRYAVDLGDPDHALFGLAGGQSGHPGSPHYTDGLDDWLAGRPRPLWMHASDVSYHQKGTWELDPAHP
jgi:penicillin amidase